MHRKTDLLLNIGDIYEYLQREEKGRIRIFLFESPARPWTIILLENDIHLPDIGASKGAIVTELHPLYAAMAEIKTSFHKLSGLAACSVETMGCD